MTLYREDPPGTFTPWFGDELNGYMYSTDIERLETPEWLAERGLYVPVDPGVPEGVVVLSNQVERVEGVVTMVYTTRPFEPIDCPITMRQLRLGLRQFGGKRANYIQQIIDDIVDPVEQDAAQIWYDETTLVEWGNPMTQYFIAKTEFTAEQTAAMWMAAFANIPA